MKSLFVNTFLLGLYMASVTSCGSGGSTNATLQVSRAFMSTNPYFKGGLIIKGRNLTTGASFFQGLDLTTNFTTKLDKGRWIISAVGWDGGTADLKFAGTPYCGMIDQTLDSDSAILDLSVKVDNCQKFIFSKGHIDSTPATPTFKKLGLINTCRTFIVGDVLPTDTISDKIATAATSDYFCESPGLKKDIKSDVKSIQIFAINKDITSPQHTVGFGSACIKSMTVYPSIAEPSSGTAMNPYQTGNELRLPLDSAAFLIRTFEEDNCTKPIADYPFRDGLTNGGLEFDSLLFSRNTTEVKLLLPSSDSRHAYSVFEAILPSVISYNAGAPGLFPTEPASISYVTQVEKGINKVKINGVYSCAISGPYTNSLTLIPGSCVLTNDGIELQIDTTSSIAGTAASFTIAGATYSFYVVVPAAEETRMFNIQKLLLTAIGYSGSDTVRQFYDLHEDDKTFGTLTKIREMLSSGGAGGVLGISDPTLTFEQACYALQDERTIRIQKYEKADEYYKVSISNAPTLTYPTNFTCNTTNVNEASCTTVNSYQKRMKIFDLSKSSTTPEMTLEFHCGKPVGRMETASLEIKNTPYSLENQIITWNTEPSNNYSFQRFEKISVRKELNAAFMPSGNESREIQRFQKIGENDFELINYAFDTRVNNTAFDQMASFSRVKFIGGQTHYKIDQVNTTNLDRLYVLTDVSYNTFLDLNPISVLATKRYQIQTAYPPLLYTSSEMLTDFTTANLIDNTLNLKPRSLNHGYFSTAFGQGFLKN